MENPNIFRYLYSWLGKFEQDVNTQANKIFPTIGEKAFYEGYLEPLIKQFADNIEHKINSGEKVIDLQVEIAVLITDIDQKFDQFLKRIEVNEDNQERIRVLDQRVKQFKEVITNLVLNYIKNEATGVKRIN